MRQGIDCATPLTPDTAQKIKASGYTFACRYLVPEDGWKALTRGEAEVISTAGLETVSVFETTANRALDGYAAGLEDGAIALQVAAAVGQPKGSCIYFAVDFEATKSQMPTVLEYIRGAREAVPGYFTGVYGSYAVILACNAAGVCDKYWQTYAWSSGQKADFINIYQFRNGMPLHGIVVDWNTAYGDEGGWSLKQERVSRVPNWTTEQWGEYAAYLQKAHDRGWVTYEDVQKAYNGVLTVEEALLLQATITSKAVWFS